jgi:hypothetical protein
VLVDGRDQALPVEQVAVDLVVASRPESHRPG